jgi:hypothetical protein
VCGDRNIDVDFVLVLVHSTDVGNIADVSEVDAASMFRVEGTEDI